ncbi:MAG: C13 family peptidase [Betaproteobacteria bacterium]|nr:C13 family peptidase [Betaproteobacteria bacterium]
MLPHTSTYSTIRDSSLLDDLSQLGRVLTLRRPAPGSFSPDSGKLPWLVLLYCLISIALSIALNGWADGAVKLDVMVFAPFGAVAVIAGLLEWFDEWQDGGTIWLVFALLLLLLPLAGFIGAMGWPVVSKLTFLAHVRDTLPGLASRLAGTLPDSVSWLADRLPGLASHLANRLPHFISSLPHAWLALAGTLFIARAGSSGWRRVLYVPLTLPALFAAFTSVDPLALWQISTPVPVAEAANVKNPPIDEEVFYGQPRLLDEKLARIEAGTPDVPEIFFLGVAGSEEGVFMREVITVEQLFRDRYATAGHSMILVNNLAMARTLPFATHESLSRALRRIGEQMNGEEDLLFLFLTSHGSADHRFSIKLSPFGFSDLTPQMLRKALDDADIKHRVVVISACYSGGFIPALADENTLVITAASADHNSFGCNDTNDLTDFGRAYFDEALRETRSFTEAFERAKATIAARETANGSNTSNPQIAGGESLLPLLERFARETEPEQAE